MEKRLLRGFSLFFCTGVFVFSATGCRPQQPASSSISSAPEASVEASFSSASSAPPKTEPVAPQENKSVRKNLIDAGEVVVSGVEGLACFNAGVLEDFLHAYYEKTDASADIYQFRTTEENEERYLVYHITSTAKGTSFTEDRTHYYAADETKPDVLSTHLGSFVCAKNRYQRLFFTVTGRDAVNRFVFSLQDDDILFPQNAEHQPEYSLYLRPVASSGLLTTNWQSSSELLDGPVFPCIFSNLVGKQQMDLYRKQYSSEKGRTCMIPQDMVESVILPYFNLASGDLRTSVHYDRIAKAYNYAPKYPPLPGGIRIMRYNEAEFVITIRYEWYDRVTGEALMKNTLTIETDEDGNFIYSSNLVSASS